MPIRPGEIYYADMGGDNRHRAIVVSREQLNGGKYIVVVPMTSQKFDERKDLSNCVPFSAGEFGLVKNCVAQAEHVTFIEKSVLDLEHGPIGSLDDERMRSLVKAIGYVIDADCELC